MAGIWDKLGEQPPSNPETTKGTPAEPAGNVWEELNRQAINPPVPEKRGLGGALKDYSIELGAAALSLPKAGFDFFSPGSEAGANVGKAIDYLEAGKSQYLKAEQAELAKSMQSEDLLEQAKGAAQYVIRNPGAAAAQAIGSFIGPGAAIKGGKILGGALNLSEKAAGRVALGAGSATTGVLAGGDAAGDAYQTVMNSPSLANLPINEREQMATDAARKASVVPFIIGAATGLTGAEKALATGTKSILRTGATEFASEAVEEGATKLSANIAAKQYAPETSIGSGVVGSAVLGGMLGGGTGLAIGALTKQPDSLLQGSTNISTGYASPDSNAIDKAIDSNSTEIAGPATTDIEIDRIRQQQAALDEANAVADQQAQVAAVQQAQVQQQEAQAAFNQGAATYGVTPVEGTTRYQVAGKNLFTQADAVRFLQTIDSLNKDKSEEQKSLIGAALSSGAVKVAADANPKAVNSAAIKFLSGWGFDTAVDKADAAERANIVIGSLEGPKALKQAEQVNNFYKSITGTNSPAFDTLIEAAQQQPKLTKGASNEQLQLQTNAGLRAVPVQGRATQTSGNQPGDVRPTSVQPIQSGSVGAGSLGIQTGAVPSGGIPTSTTAGRSGINLPSESRPQEAQIIADERVEAINQIENIAKRAFGERDYQIIMEFIQSDAAVNQSDIARQFNISRQRVNQIVGAAKEGESFGETIQRRAQESWGPRFLLAARNMGIPEAEVRGLFATIQTSQDETALAAQEQAKSLSEGATEEELRGKETQETELEGEEERTLGIEETSDTEKGAAGYRVFTPGVSGETGIEDTAATNKAKFSKKAIEKMTDVQLQNLAADEDTTPERLDDIVAELLRRQDIRVAKGESSAVQKPSTEKKAVRNKPAASEGVREQNAEERKAPREGQTDEEAAAEAWNEGIKDFPEAPKFEELTAEQQEDWVSFGPENWTKDDVQTELVKLAKSPKYSLFSRTPKGAWSAEKLKTELKKTFASDEAFDELVTIVNSVKELPADLQASIKKEVDGDVAIGGFVDGGKIYLLSHNIQQGQELAVLLHELGAHVGLEKLLGSYNYSKLYLQIEKWASGKGTPIEVKIAKAAQQRLKEHLEASPESKQYANDELIAYFVEEAILAGVNPTATEVKGAGQIIQFLRSIVASMKVALRKIGFNKFDDLTASNIVDLAFGAAKLELDGVYHGTKSNFRAFLDEKVTIALQGWGHYGANAVDVTKAYGPIAKRALPLAAQEDLINNDKPLRDQPAILKKIQDNIDPAALKAITKDSTLGRMSGIEFQEALGLYELETNGLYSAMPKAVQDTTLGIDAKEVTSRYMEKVLGIPGSISKPFAKFGKQGQKNGRNVAITVMFSGKNLPQVATQLPSGEMKFSLKKAREQADKQLDKLPKEVQGPVRYVTDTIEDLAKNALPYFAFTEDLAEIAAKLIPSAKTYVDLMKNRQAIRTRLERQVDDVLQDYDKLPSEVKGTGENSVNKFLLDSTREGKWAYNPGWIKNFDEKKDIDQDMQARFDAMPAAAQSMIKRVFAHGQSSLLAMQKAVIENITSDYDALIDAARKAGDVKEEQDLVKKKANSLTDYRTLMRINAKKPYAPLKRFGDYVVVGKSQQFLDNEKIVNDENAAPDVVAEARSKLRELEKNDMHYFVQFAETVGEAKAIAREEANNYAQVEDFEKDTSHTFGGRDLQSMFHRLRNMVEDTKEAGMQDASERAVNRLLSDLHLTLLSEQSARQSERRRRGIGGAEKDMMRAFATQGRATASFISSLENTKEVYDTLREMKEEADKGKVGTRAERRKFYNEFMKRHFMGMDYRPSPFMDKALSTTSMWMLLTNPAYYLQNMTQPFMMSLPVIGGKHGYARSWKEMTRAYTDIASVIKKHGLSENSYNKLPEDVRKVVEELVNRGRIDISLEQDLGRWRSAEDSKLAKFGRASELLRGMAQDIETINRVATAVAAYRMEVKTSNPTRAINYADKIIYMTHGDYSGFNAPRITRQGLGRLATQFRKFQLIQISLMARLYNDAFKHEDPDTRLIGKKALAFTVGHTAIMGGLMGLPGFAAVAALYGMMFGDEDEPDNPELALRRAIGDDSLADLLVKGVPAALGVDVSGKLGMGQMLSILPYTDVKFTRKELPQAGYALLTGPFGGLTLKGADAINYMGSGDYQKGLEQLLPSGLGNVLKAERLATEGITTRAGDVVMKPEDISAVDAFMVALGLPTKPITDRNFLNAAKFQYDEFYNDKASEIKRAYTRAYKEGDNAGLTEAREDWKALQESRAKNGYSKQPLSNLLKAPQEQKKRERNVTGGVQFNKSNRGFVKQTSEL